MAPGFGDMSKADTVQEGMEELAGDISVQYFIPDTLPTTVTEAQDIIEELAESRIYDLIIAVGAEIAPAVQSVATDFPTQKFGIIGAHVNLANVASSSFATQESAFLGGVIAAFLAYEQPYYGTDPYDGTIGILAAMEDDVELTPMINGFIQGVEDANETYDLNISITMIDYVDSWNDSLTAEGLVYTWFTQYNLSVIFAPVRASMPGVREGMIRSAAAFQPAQIAEGRMPLVIAAEGDQDYYGCADPDIPVAPSWITTSVLARTDLALYNLVNMTLWDMFPGGTLTEFNLANNGVNITQFEFSSTYISTDLRDALDYYEDLIVNGTDYVTP